MDITYTVGIIGDRGCGKTVFMLRHATGDFSSEPSPISQCMLKFATTKGSYNIVCTEDKYDCDAMIYMMNLVKPQNEQKIERILARFTKPKVLCGNKCDRISARSPVAFVRHLITTQAVKYFGISAKSNYNIEKPFLHILRELTSQPDLEFVAMNVN